MVPGAGEDLSDGKPQAFSFVTKSPFENAAAVQDVKIVELGQFGGGGDADVLGEISQQPVPAGKPGATANARAQK